MSRLTTDDAYAIAAGIRTQGGVWIGAIPNAREVKAEIVQALTVAAIMADPRKSDKVKVFEATHVLNKGVRS